MNCPLIKNVFFVHRMFYNTAFGFACFFKFIFMKKLHFCLFLFLPILSLSLSAQTAVKFTITGHILQKKGEARLLLYNNNSEFVPFDSVDIKNGVFIISGTLNEPKSFMLEAGERRSILFVGNETITATEKDSTTGEIIKGSSLTNDYDYYFNRWIAPLMSELTIVNKALEHLDSTHQPQIDSLNKLQSALFVHVPDSTLVFIKEKPHSFVSLYFLNYYSQAYDVNTIESLYNHLDDKLKKYPTADVIRKKIKILSTATKDEQAMDNIHSVANEPE